VHLDAHGLHRALSSLPTRRSSDLKSGIMLGLGEERQEVINTMGDLREAGVDVVTIGQYLQPSKKHLPVKQFILPEQFKTYRDIRSEEHTSELQSRENLVCRLLLEK